VIVPAIGATRWSRADAVGLLELRDLVVRPAEDAQPVRTAASAISAERRSPWAPTRSDCACSRSLSAPPRIACSSRCRFSAVCASTSRERAFSTPATAVIEVVVALHELAGFDGEQRRAAFRRNRQGRAINLLTRPEKGEKIGVVVSSLMAILPSVARSSRRRPGAPPRA